MAMPAHSTEWTVEMVRALPDDGNRYEVVDGELFVTSASEYWIVDVDDRRVERWHPNDAAPETLASTLEWRPDRFTEPLTIDLPQYFARVRG